MRSAVEIVFGLERGGFATLEAWVQRVFLENTHTLLPDLRAPVAEPLTGADYGKIKCPTLIVRGDRTHAQYKLMAELALASLSRGSDCQLEGVGHGGPAQMPRLFADAVLNFVESVPA
jgi:pimeloyl-ACP methyl ester carboxylesterase